MCLTTQTSKGPNVFIGDCTKPETLTHWDVEILGPIPTAE